MHLKLKISQLIFLVCIIFDISFAQIIFTEIMFNAQGSDYHDEFVEIYNLSETESVDLSQWQFSDSSDADYLSNDISGNILAPHRYAIILDGSYFSNSSTYDEIIPDSVLILQLDDNTFGSAGLSNSYPESLYLINAEGDTVESYRYSIDNAEGYSDEKLILENGNAITNWGNSLVFGGTPGFQNSITPYNFDLSLPEFAIQYHPALSICTGQTVEFNLIVKNSGIYSFADSVHLKFFVDANDDNLFQNDEIALADENFWLELDISEEAEFEVEWTPQLAGNYKICLQIDSNSDHNKMNNFTFIELSVYESIETVIINEIKFLTKENEPEWLEIYNTGNFKLSLKGWGIADAVDTSWIDSTIWLYPAQYKIITADTGLSSLYDTPDSQQIVLRDLPILNNSGDVIYLLNPLQGWVEQVPYKTDWLEDEEYRLPSLERIHQGLDCRKSSSWGPSTAVDNATPGKQNSIFINPRQKENIKVTCSPDPFSPDGDGYEDYTLIQMKAPVKSGRLRIRIFDINGRKVRTIRDNVYSGANYSVAWDGRNDNGRKLRMGIYIVLVQILDDRKGVYKEYKKTVVLAAKLN